MRLAREAMRVAREVVDNRLVAAVAKMQARAGRFPVGSTVPAPPTLRDVRDHAPIGGLALLDQLRALVG